MILIPFVLEKRIGTTRLLTALGKKLNILTRSFSKLSLVPIN